MTDRPILFSGPMVRALLAGRKTQTRRILKPQPIGFDWHDLKCKPRIEIGDRLWVREAHYLTDDGDDEYAVYVADGNDATGEHLHEVAALEKLHPTVDWSRHKKQRPSIHMPRWASRITLIVTDVRVERLQEISEADAIAEGIAEIASGDKSLRFWKRYRDGGWNGYVDSPIASYASLWTEINGPGSWEANPWVVAYTSTVIKQNIDEVGL
ncbi:hypothetical protein [Sinorhizobium fredii]|uniref:hypothetical protein n=1 Tax=Rhizobium fredii TaxID=380 RepID=UPI0004B300EF|nr:hypothetical protein [Sinorhizobium fredii]AWI57148.1 hypothetical protein AB395_00001489 [Sinorhizobium fredii CCBAU 45436]